MDAITRTHAKLIFDWWSGRVNPTDRSKPLHANSANKDLTNLRILFERFWDFQGEEQRDNPFRNLRFKNVVYKDIPAFENDWIENRILAPGALDDLNLEARCILLALVETGCRPSEIANLKPEHIVLDHDVPHLETRVNVLFQTVFSAPDFIKAQKSINNNEFYKPLNLLGFKISAKWRILFFDQYYPINSIT